MKRGLVQVADNSEQFSFYLTKGLAVFVVVTPPAGESNDTWSPAKSIGMFVEGF
jgi:hypothetical protein